MTSSSGDVPEVDLHGRRPADAERYAALQLHAARVRGDRRVVIVTGRGWGNAQREPVLRTRIERWLAGTEARRLGVRGFRRVAKGGALEVDLL